MAILVFDPLSPNCLGLVFFSPSGLHNFAMSFKDLTCYSTKFLPVRLPDGTESSLSPKVQSQAAPTWKKMLFFSPSSLYGSQLSPFLKESLLNWLTLFHLSRELPACASKHSSVTATHLPSFIHCFSPFLKEIRRREHLDQVKAVVPGLRNSFEIRLFCCATDVLFYCSGA